MFAFEDLPAPSRFSRQESIAGWSQGDLARARVLVAGVGALGNELLKNLALLGVGTLGVIDFDRVEESNLPRCVLFRAGDIGRPKAEVAAASLRTLTPEIHVLPYAADLMTEIGAGLLEEFDLLLGAVDSAGARWQLNRLSRRAGRRWIDGGVDAWCGQVSVFDRTEGACYECGLTEAMWAEIHQRRSCAAAAPPVERAPMAVALPVVALTAALQAQEAVLFLMNRAPGGGVKPGQRVSVSLRPYELAVLQARPRASCLAHGEDPGPALGVDVGLDCPVEDLLERAGAEKLELSWEVVHGLVCARCGTFGEAMPVWRMRPVDLVCPQCGRDRRPEQTAILCNEDPLTKRTLAELGVPRKAHLHLKGRSGGAWFWCKLT